MKKQLITLNINGEDMDLRIAPTDILADVLRKGSGPHRYEEGLRSGRLRCLHSYHRR